MIGMKVAKARSCPMSAGSTWPVTRIVEAASSRPMSIEPESPMKMRAGLKLCGRNPMQAPTRNAVIREARLAYEEGEGARASEEGYMNEALPEIGAAARK